MNHHIHADVIDACHACADACDHCAVSCLQEPDTGAMARCIALDMDCAQACRLAASFLARGSAYDREACRLCVAVCDACADECAQHPMDHCQACAEACRVCASACRQLREREPHANGHTPAHA